MFIIGGPGSEKTGPLFNLIVRQPDIDNIYLHAMGPYEAIYQLQLKKREGESLKHCNN